MGRSREVQVRTIDGQILKLTVNSGETVQHLKLQLQHLKWPPDKQLSVQWHIFFRGGKLDASTQLDSLALLDEDFLVLIPYTRKNKSKRRKVDCKFEEKTYRHDSPSKTQIKDGNDGVVCTDDASPTLLRNGSMKPAESMWHAIIADLAAVDAVSKETEANDLLRDGRMQLGKAEVSARWDLPRKEEVYISGEELQTERKKDGETSNTRSTENFDENLRDQPGVLKNLRDVRSWDHGKLHNVSSHSNISSLPPMLDKLNRVFISLNTVCGFLQKQHMQATWKNVKQALQQLCCLKGEQVTVQDISLLAALCPRLVVLSNMTGEGEDCSFYIDLFDPATLKKQEQLNSTNIVTATNIEQIGPSDSMPSSVGKQVSDRLIRSAVGRRHKAFQKALTKLVEHLQVCIKEQRLRFAVSIACRNWVNGNRLTPLVGYRNPIYDSFPNTVQKNGKQGTSDVTADDFMTAAKTIIKEDETDRTLKAALPRPPRGHKKLARCTSVAILGALEMMQHLKKGLGSLGQVVHCEHIPHREAAYGQLQETLTSCTEAALMQMGITRLYTHQAQAINAAMSRESVIVATSTASGKSLCYNVPVLDELYRNQDSCALYLFPTKALAQDQLRALAEMSKNTEVAIRMGVYDGDTPHDQRLMLRDSARLLITNPDMLHVSIMPSHRQFNRILSNLRYVVVDEAHAYRGVFGCHTALILRRLRRLCQYLCGTEPTFVVCTATIANPSEHAQELLGLRKIKVVQNDGSPCGDKLFLFWNPPVCYVPATKTKHRLSASADLGQASGVIMGRASPIVEVATIFAEMVQHGLRCISFCKSRKLCELVFNYTREILKETAPQLVNTIRSYRGGYSAQERRSIESDLFGGNLRGVAATNALELGVDVGSLDGTLHLGFPGTVASLWQQSGRAGRREKPSLSIYVAFGGPLDQYFMKFPDRLFARPIENAQVDAHNQQVMEQHLLCAASEYPLHVGHDDVYFGSGLETTIMELVNRGKLGRHPSNGPEDTSWHYIGEEKFPSRVVSIRAIDPERYKIIDLATNEIIEEVEERKAFFQVYEGAVYMNQGKTYLVKKLDLAAKKAFCQEADLKYYTKTRDLTDVHVSGGELAYPRNINKSKYRSTTAQASNCKVTTQWIGYRRIWLGTNEQFDSVDLFLPHLSYDSQAAWIRLPPQVRVELPAEGLLFREGLHAANHALLNVMPLYIMCNPSDLGTECVNPKDTRYFPERLLVFDQHPGGIGIAAQARPMFGELLQAAAELLAACECTTDNGCPCCVQTLNCSEYNEVINKRAAKIIIQRVIQAEDIFRETRSQAPAPRDGFLKHQLL